MIGNWKEEGHTDTSRLQAAKHTKAKNKIIQCTACELHACLLADITKFLEGEDTAAEFSVSVAVCSTLLIVCSAALIFTNVDSDKAAKKSYLWGGVKGKTEGSHSKSQIGERGRQMQLPLNGKTLYFLLVATTKMSAFQLTGTVNLETTTKAAAIETHTLGADAEQKSKMTLAKTVTLRASDQAENPG
jgi:hypothetical protein